MRQSREDSPGEIGLKLEIELSSSSAGAFHSQCKHNVVALRPDQIYFVNFPYPRPTGLLYGGPPNIGRRSRTHRFLQSSRAHAALLLRSSFFLLLFLYLSILFFKHFFSPAFSFAFFNVLHQWLTPIPSDDVTAMSGLSFYSPISFPLFFSLFLFFHTFF